MRNYDTKVYAYTDKATGIPVVKATTMYAGKAVSAVAKCDPLDTFDPNLGATLALKRLDYKIALKRAATCKQRAKGCQEVIDFYKQEIKRMLKAKDNAEVLASDHLVEAAELKAEIDTITAYE